MGEIEEVISLFIESQCLQKRSSHAIGRIYVPNASRYILTITWDKSPKKMLLNQVNYFVLGLFLVSRLTNCDKRIVIATGSHGNGIITGIGYRTHVTPTGANLPTAASWYSWSGDVITAQTICSNWRSWSYYGSKQDNRSRTNYSSINRNENRTNRGKRTSRTNIQCVGC
jgi:hypothetical protein